MSEQNKIELCDHCKNELVGDSCSHCDRSKALKRIDGAYILSEIGSVLNFEKGIFYTMRELLIRPGQNVRHFIHEDRARLVKPIVFIIVCSLTYTILQRIIEFEDGYVNFSFDNDSASTAIFEWLTRNYGYTNILIALFIGLWVKIMFRKQDYNFFEVLILLCFIIGMGMLVFSFFGIVDSLVNLKIVDKGFFIGILYISWGIGDFFKGNKLLNSLKGFVSYILGLMSFTIIMLMVGFMIDWISK